MERKRFIQYGILGFSAALMSGCGLDSSTNETREMPSKYVPILDSIKQARTIGGNDIELMHAVDLMRPLTVDLLYNSKTLHFRKGDLFRAHYPFKSDFFQCVASFEYSTNVPSQVRALFFDPGGDRGTVVNGIAMTSFENSQKNYATLSSLLSVSDMSNFYPYMSSGAETLNPAVLVLMPRLFKGGAFDPEMAEKIRTFCDRAQYSEVNQV